LKHKIVVDALPLLSSFTGIGRYTYEVTKQLQKSDAFAIEFFYGYFSSNLIEASSNPRLKSVKSSIIKNSIVKSIVRKVLFWASGLFSKKYDLYWEPNFIPLKSIKSERVIATVHDFSWELYPEFQPSERVKYFKKNFYKQIEKVDFIITGSEFTKQEILNRIGIQDEKIRVIYHGLNHHVFYDCGLEKPEQKYILAVGSLEPRKNLKNLLLAYEMMDNNFKDTHHLILVGASGWNNSEIMSKIDQMQKWVKYSGYVSDEELAMLYGKASLFIYPSFYEGFGIPPLEAMACGVPVVCSNSSSLPEVGGDAVVYCDPYSVENIKEKIELVLGDKELQKQMIQKGLERAKMFSWDKSAMEHMKVFEEVLKN